MHEKSQSVVKALLARTSYSNGGVKWMLDMLDLSSDLIFDMFLLLPYDVWMRRQLIHNIMNYDILLRNMYF